MFFPSSNRLRGRALLRFLALSGLALALCQPCVAGETAASNKATVHRLQFGGRDRSYRLYRPAALAKTAGVPLVVMLHGRHDSGRYAESAYHWDTTADAHGFVVAYPNGYHGTWNGGECCGASQKDGIDDTGFLTELVKNLIASENIDPKRVYLAGMSNGGIMAYRMACDSSFHFAAIGSVSGDLLEVCKEVHPTSVIEVHGGQDRLLPLEGKHALGDEKYLPSVQTTLDHWIIADRCDDAHSVVTGVITDMTRSCDAGKGIELVVIADAGHQWPGSKRHLRVDDLFGTAEPSRLMNATEKLWTFFAAHPLQ